MKILNKGFVSIKIIIIIIIILGVAYYLIPKKTEVAPDTIETQMREAIILEDKKVMDTAEDMPSMTYSHTGILADVTGGSSIRGVDTEGKSSGIAKAVTENNVYSLFVSFDDLPDPSGTDFYEGWVVRRGLNFSVISTGKTKKVDGKYVNMYQSETDLIDHDFYVLTLEPDDGNPAPAEHILEGVLSK